MLFRPFLWKCFLLAGSFAMSDVAVAQMGIGIWPGSPGYGGLYSGYTGYRGYETGYPANLDATGPAYGYGNSLIYAPGMPRTGGMGYYAQPINPGTRRPSPFLYRQPNNSPRYYDGSTGGQLYSGSSPVITTAPVVPASPPVVYDNGEIVLFSPPSNTEDVQYVLNGVSYTMKPGNLQKFANDRTWTIDVSLGNGKRTKYSLATGNFKFKQTDAGMGLFTSKDSPEAPTPVPAPAPVPDPEPSAIPANDPPAPIPMPVE